MTVNFKKWYVEDDRDTYNFPDEAMETAFNAGMKVASQIIRDDLLQVAKLSMSPPLFSSALELIEAVKIRDRVMKSEAVES